MLGDTKHPSKAAPFVPHQACGQSLRLSHASKGLQDFRIEQAIGFKRHLATVDIKGGHGKLSKATITSTLYAMRDFVAWLAEQKGFGNKLSPTDADYFKPSCRDER